MVPIRLTCEVRAAVERVRRPATTAAPLHARCQRLRVSADGWAPLRIAAQLAYHPHTVRAVLRRVQGAGRGGVGPAAPDPPPDTARRQQVTDALAALLGEERPGTAAQLAAALGEPGSALSVRQPRR